MAEKRAPALANQTATSAARILLPSTFYIPVQVIATNVSNHPAAKAWKKIPGHADPRAIQILQEDNRRSAVYRLIGAGPGGITIIAHRRKPRAAVVERAIYENILPRLPVTALRWYGSTFDEDTQLHWLFTEDAGEGGYSTDIQEHRAVAANWLGALNISAQQLRRQSCLPDRSSGHYLEALRLGRAGILKIVEHPVVAAEDRLILTAIASHCDSIEKRWDAISRFCDRIPPTLVHGDLASKNLCIRTDHHDPRVFVMDWEHAGWGVPATDLAQFTFGSASPDLEVYSSVVKPGWPHLAFTDLQRLAELGNLFRVISALSWANSGFRAEYFDWYLTRVGSYDILEVITAVYDFDWYMMMMKFYESPLRAWVERAAAYG
jgi:phosphotransferase family enzyme